MAQIIDELRGLYLVYPPWLVSACLAIVGLGAAWILWKLIRFGMVIVVALLLLLIVTFAGWMILSS